MAAAHERGTPVIRPLFYDFPRQPEAWDVEDQYMFGPDVLVAPILHEGWRERRVRLPSGVDWLEAASGRMITGGATVTAAAPLERIPVFVRAGAQVASALMA